MRYRIAIVAAGWLSVGTLLGQESSRKAGATREIESISENDIIFFEDEYYTAGQDLVYRMLAKPGKSIFRLFAGKAPDSAKVIISYRAGIKIFNPSDIYARTPAGMDQPYAGWSFGQFGISSFRKPNSGNSFVIESGVVGPISGAGKLQLWVHKLTTYDPPKGWSTQIRNEFVTNVIYTHYQNWKFAEDVDLVSQSTFIAGTGMNRASQDITLRLIHFNSINNSAITQSRLTWDEPEKGDKPEIYIFGGIGADYTLTNIFIEGSLFDSNASVFSTRANPWIVRQNIGVTYSNRKVSWTLVFNHLSAETAKSHTHDYAGFHLARRF